MRRITVCTLGDALHAHGDTSRFAALEVAVRRITADFVSNANQ
ncbi:hypothetical protein [Mycobacterium decipiens]|nr:hypothetical protein [Mycobacterium decipiens]